MLLLGAVGIGLSPRGRGKLGQSHFPIPTGRSIPAWAGETRGAYFWLSTDTVYPRVGGGNVVVYPSGGVTGGLSPRGRGNTAMVKGKANE